MANGMSGRSAPSAIVLLLMSVSVSYANARSLELVSSFQSFCTQQPLTFDAVDAKAKAMQAPVRKDERIPASGRLRVLSKSWLVSLNSGPYELSAGITQSPDSAAASCAMAAANVDVNEMRLALVGALNLGAPYIDVAAADGKPRVTAWNYGAAAALWLSGGTAAKPIVHLQLVRSLY
jgi:hypothetical protein